MSAVSTTAATGPRDARLPLLLAGLCVAGMALTWVLAALVPATHVRDAVALYDFTRLDRPIVEVPASLLLELLKPVFYVVWGIALIAVAVSRGRPRVALAIPLVLTLASLSADLLKPLFAYSHYRIATEYITSASWPSGHSTAALALVWCALLVCPPERRRLVAALGVAFALAVGVALLILAWHMPSDVLGGYLLATFWALLAVAALRVWERRSPAASISRRPSIRPRVRLATTAAPSPTRPRPRRSLRG